MSDSRLARQTAERLIGSRAQLLKFNCLLGFDGFVDTFFETVQERHSLTKHTPYASLAAFLKDLSTKKKTLFEIAPAGERIGGDGPLATFAMSTLGAPADYIGLAGSPSVHPAFSEFAKRARVHSIGSPGTRSTCIFPDGSQYTLAQSACVYDVNWDHVKKKVGDKALQKAWHDAHFVGMMSWSRMPHMSALWKKMLSEIKVSKEGKRKLIFFDLGDTSERSDAELVAALKIMSEFQVHGDVMLGLNEKEALHVAKALRLKNPAKTPKAYAALAQVMRDKLQLAVVAIHPEAYACGADAEGEHVVNGPYTAKPRITMGAGAHFDAGFSIGKLLGLGMPHALQLAVACSGFYVRHGASPNREQLVRFLQTL